MLHRPLPNAENVAVKAPHGRQRISDVFYVARARARRPEPVDRLQLCGTCPAQIALGCLRCVVAGGSGRRQAEGGRCRRCGAVPVRACIVAAGFGRRGRLCCLNTDHSRTRLTVPDIDPRACAAWVLRAKGKGKLSGPVCSTRRKRVRTRILRVCTPLAAVDDIFFFRFSDSF